MGGKKMGLRLALRGLLYLCALACTPVVSQSVCNDDWCSSPRNGAGGHSTDCWAGTEREPCTCLRGEARYSQTASGHSTGVYRGSRIYRYTCCEGGNNVGEECGNYRELTVVALLFSILFSICGFMLCIGCIVYCFYAGRSGRDRLHPYDDSDDERERRVVVITREQRRVRQGGLGVALIPIQLKQCHPLHLLLRHMTRFNCLR